MSSDDTLGVTRTRGGERGGPLVELTRVIVAYSPDPQLVGSMRVLGEEALVVGRSGATLALPDARASRAHAVLELRDGRPFVRDLGSRNGTYVNGERVVETELSDQDVLRMGDHCLVVQGLHHEDVRRALDAPPRLEPLVGDGRAMRELRESIVRAADGTLPVLLLGETGTGKELVASEIHRLSGRRGAFVPVNCAAIPRELAEGELFGYVRGAYTGAVDDGAGLFRAAEGGTLLLDEIGEMPLALQPKLLRALATGEVRRVGDPVSRRVDVRIVAATHVDLEESLRNETFRADLLARLAAHVIRIPPLRQRREDVLLLAATFLTRALGLRADRLAPGDAIVRGFAPDAADALLRDAWPFNVRGLEQTIRVAATRLGEREERIDLAHLGGAFRLSPPTPAFSTTEDTGRVPLTRLLEIRHDTIPSAEELRLVSEHFGGNVSRIASFFGKDRKQIYRWLEQYDFDLDATRER